MSRFPIIACLITATAAALPAQQPPATPNPAQRPARPTYPTRDPNTPGYVKAQELPDGENAPPNKDGNFIIGPTHTATPESTAREDVPKGAIIEFTMQSSESKI